MAAPDAVVGVLVPGQGELWESPLWEPDLRALVWVDILAGLVHVADLSGEAPAEVITWPVGCPVGAVARHRPATVLLATAEDFRLLDIRTGSTKHIAKVEADVPGNRMNDGKVDPAGNFWAGTMSIMADAGAGGLYRLDSAGRVTQHLKGLSVSNGLGWSPDRTYFYHVDSPDRVVRRYRVDLPTGLLGAAEVLLDTSTFIGTPDGLTVDAEGCLWVCFWGGSAVRRFAPDGALLRTVLLPVTQPTSCAFVGADLRTLAVTTARYGLPIRQVQQQPLAGSVLALRAEGIGPGVEATPWGQV